MLALRSFLYSYLHESYEPYYEALIACIYEKREIEIFSKKISKSMFTAEPQLNDFFSFNYFDNSNFAHLLFVVFFSVQIIKELLMAAVLALNAVSCKSYKSIAGEYFCEDGKKVGMFQWKL